MPPQLQSLIAHTIEQQHISHLTTFLWLRPSSEVKVKSFALKIIGRFHCSIISLDLDHQFFRLYVCMLNIYNVLITLTTMSVEQQPARRYLFVCFFPTTLNWPRTCCSRLRMTATAWCRISNLVWGLSLFRCSCTILPSSLNASLMSRTRRRSRALFAIRRSRSLSIFCSGDRSSSSLLLRWPMRGDGAW